MQPLDRTDDRAAGETPEDVAILYSWANLEGAKYRDFSANRREYRAQMRHRAAEQLRLMELRAQSEAEAAAVEAEAEAAAAHAEADAASVKLAASRTMQATTAPVTPEEEHVELMRKSSLREAAQQARRAAAERLEAARRAEAAALADSIARREEREIAEAQASALRQAAQYAEAEVRGRQKKTSQPENAVPGRISDPYGPQVVPEGEYFERPGTPVAELEASRFRHQREYVEENAGAKLPQFRIPGAVAEAGMERFPSAKPLQRPRGYRPDEPSGQHQTATDESLAGRASAEMPKDFEPRRQPKPVFEERNLSISREAHRKSRNETNGNPSHLGRGVVPSIPYKEFRRVTGAGAASVTPEVVSRLSEDTESDESDAWRAGESLIGTGHSRLRGVQPRVRDIVAEGRTVAGSKVSAAQVCRGEDSADRLGEGAGGLQQSRVPRYQSSANGKGRVDADDAVPIPPMQSTRDSWGVAWKQPDPRVANSQPTWLGRPEAPVLESVRPDEARPPVDVSGPAWLYPKPQAPRFVDSLADSGVRRRAQLEAQSLRAGSVEMHTQPLREAVGRVSSQARGGAVESTLQQSRENVASRWFALNGVFAKADREAAIEKQTPQEKKRDTPFVVVYSLVGGVGKTSLVATLGRALSSMGERVLLTDTTSQGLLPYYFGASELYAGVVRTFSPPAGSTDAPIHLVSYDCAPPERDPEKSANEIQSEVFEDLLANSQRASRVVMDLNMNCGWMMDRLAGMKPTILIPLVADMNSVISLRSVEKNFSGMKDAEGKPLQPLYLLNQFDASLPLHLDVREVLKQQLGDRLLPFVIRRAAGVSEALAEGMTIVDYDPESEVARDYMGVANWLRNASAPITVGIRSLRWSER